MWQNLIDATAHLAGFAIVLIALGGLWGLTALVGLYFKRSEATAAAGPAPAQPAAALAPSGEPAPADGTDPNEILAVIAAATSLMLDQPHRVVSVRSTPSRWGVQGRSDLHASHRLR